VFWTQQTVAVRILYCDTNALQQCQSRKKAAYILVCLQTMVLEGAFLVCVDIWLY